MEICSVEMETVQNDRSGFGEHERRGSLAWLNVTQFFGALNDNVFKLLLTIFLVDRLGSASETKIVVLASAVFVAPFLLFSHAGGVLADRFSKRSIIVWMKWFELVVMLLGVGAVVAGSPVGLFAMLFLMCTQSALFSPSKYGVLPEIVEPERLSRANSLLESLTYLAIIIGTFLPSFLLDSVLSKNFVMLSGVCVVIAVLGLVAAYRMQVTPAGTSKSRFSAGFVLDIYRTLRGLRRDRFLYSAVLGSAYFIFLAAFIQQNTFLYGRGAMGLDSIKSGYLFPVAALGIGAGALLAGLLSGRNIEFGIVPVGAIGLAATSMALGMATPGWVNALTAILLMGFFSGLFIVPLNAFIQYRSPSERRGEIIAAANFLSFLGIALSAGAIWIFREMMGLTARGCFVAVGLLTVLLSVTAILALPDFLVRFIGLVLTRCVYRIRTAGLHHVPLDGGALLVSNHITWMDSFLISATLQRRVRFLMARSTYENRWLNPIFRLMKVLPVSAGDGPHELTTSLESARKALADGYLVCIFPEGALTRNGNMRRFRPGFEKIVAGTECPIIPLHIGGAWGSIFSHYYGNPMSVLPKVVPYPVTIVFGEPLPPSSDVQRVRGAVSELAATGFALNRGRRFTLGAAFIGHARRYRFRVAVGDTTGRRLTFGRLLTGSIALARYLGPRVREQKMVGVLLPASVGGVLANVALTLLGKVPVNLNFTVSSEAFASAVQQCSMRTVVTSKAFLEKMPGFKITMEMVFLEDVASGVGIGAKCAAVLQSWFKPLSWFSGVMSVKPDDLATVIFSSGSTGEPKGVMLTHFNVLSNIESFRQVCRFGRGDGMCGVLPFFHSFGYTCTLWCPITTGFPVFFHPNPLDGAAIAGLVRKERLTVLLSTPTFLLGYIRRAEKADFKSVRLVIAGAEKLKKRVADAFEERFGVRPMEGYGATELSPVVAVNIEDVDVGGLRQVGNKEGSVGHPIPGVAAKVVDTDTGAEVPTGESGLLLVRGPNVMAGYLNRPDRTAEVMRDGWYVTGDIAKVDADGFIFLLDRLSRYSKIGGEMVPHVAIEEKIMQALNATSQVVVVMSAPDEKKGEQLVVFHTPEAGEQAGLQKVVADSDLPNLWKPRKENYAPVAAMPTLGSGKLDLKRLREMAKEFVGGRVQSGGAAGNPA